MTERALTVETDESRAARCQRLAWEAARIAEARAELDEGFGIDEAAVDAWIDSLGTEHELPPPVPRR